KNGRLSTNGIMNIIQGRNAGGSLPSNKPNYNYVYHANQFGNANELYVKQNNEDKVFVQAQVSTGAVGNTIDINQTAWDSKVGHADNGHGSGGYGIYQKGTENDIDITQGSWAEAGSAETVSDV